MKKQKVTVTDLKTGEVEEHLENKEPRSDSKSVSCVICLEEIKRVDSIWCCETCRTETHLKCIHQWVDIQYYEAGVFWSCPICRDDYALYPDTSLCYCRRSEEPENTFYGQRFSPHCCYRTCNILSKSTHGDHCTHPCPEKCHPGLCPPCKELFTFKCWCGRTDITYPCNQYRSIKVQSKSCNSVCGKILNCGAHKCINLCHEGECKKCDAGVLTIKCHTHSNPLKFFCGDSIPDSDSCEEVCGKILRCQKHKCELICHSDDCPPCPIDIEYTIRSFYGMKSFPFYNITSESYNDPIPNCSPLCGKPLICSDNAINPSINHICEYIRHDHPCPPCRKRCLTPCRCGKSTILTLCALIFYGSNNLGSCDKKCTISMNCNKHTCKLFCCVLKDHICRERCTGIAPCNIHPCYRFCHKNECPKCITSYSTNIYCKCKKTLVTPPYICSDPFPQCSTICIYVCSNSHVNKHPCHRDDIPCPPCEFKISLICNNGHIKSPQIKCTLWTINHKVACEQLLEYGHRCPYFCSPSPNISALQKKHPCLQICNLKNSKCSHPCSSICHYPYPCPKSRCNQKIQIYCSCLYRSNYIECDDYSWFISEIEKIQPNFSPSDICDKIICLPCSETCKNKPNPLENENETQITCLIPVYTVDEIKTLNKVQLEQIIKTEFNVGTNYSNGSC